MGESPAAAKRSEEAAQEAPSRSADTLGARGFDDQPLAPHSAAPHAQGRGTILGTGRGRSEASHVTYTSFERASTHPAEVITIHYDTYASLAAMGVIREPRYAHPHVHPMPFPREFVPDPR
jgi:hypothetical protein